MRKTKPPAPVPDAERLAVIRDLCEIAISGCFADIETRELLALVDAQAAEIRLLRARVRVEAADVERVGVAIAHVDAWLRANGWTPTTTFGYSAVARWTRPDHKRAILATSATAEAIAVAVCSAADWARHRGCPGLDILDEMAAMEVSP
jgi:hypothetical protein